MSNNLPPTLPLTSPARATLANVAVPAALFVAPPALMVVLFGLHLFSIVAGVSWLVVMIPAYFFMRRASAMTAPATDPMREEWQAIRRNIFKLSMNLTSQARSDLLLQYLDDMKVWDKSYHSLLAQKFQPGELTHQRYATAGIAAMVYMTARVRFAGEILAGHQNGELLPEQQAKFDQAVRECAEAFDAARKVIAGLSLIVTQPEATGVELSATVDEMLALAERAPLYSLESTNGDRK